MILVTGGTGLVGSHLIQALVREGKRVRAIKRPSSDLGMIRKVFDLYTPEPEKEFSQIEWVEADIMDIFSLEESMEGVEEVYHCAAIVSFLPEDRKRLLRINTEGTANIVNAALEKKIRKLCHVSSIAALGRPENQADLIDENLVWKTSRNNSIYAISKYGAEREVWRGTAEGLDAVIVNPSIILGVAGASMGSSRIFNSIWEGLKFYPPGINGFVDVRDVVRAMILLMNSDIRNERFILSVDNIEYKRLFDLIAAAMGKPAPHLKVSPMLLGFAWRVEKLRSMVTGVKPLITKETAHTAVQQYEYSNEKIKKELGFEFTPIEETVRHFCGIFMNG
ncbi:MAG: NAD-dependent epimerase/dehydratase family protein [Bacteroidales bacterium]|nr:NAD-dependent epimerase/dehydratase family protein [Bacteroidales bacterium]